MQVPLTLKDHIPAPNHPYLPLRFPLPDLRYPLWNHRLLESFEKDFSKGPPRSHAIVAYVGGATV